MLLDKENEVYQKMLDLLTQMLVELDEFKSENYAYYETEINKLK